MFVPIVILLFFELCNFSTFKLFLQSFDQSLHRSHSQSIINYIFQALICDFEFAITMEGAFWQWTQNLPSGHVYGVMSAQLSVRSTIYHAREQLHSIDETIYLHA